MNPYEVLNIKESASPKEIKQAYRDLIKQHHPDLNPGSLIESQIRTQKIIEAYTMIIGEENISSAEPNPSTSIDYFSDKFMCDKCGGCGHEQKIICGDCFGFGLMQVLIKKKMQNKNCSKCKGKGYEEPIICDKCNGFGVIQGEVLP